MTSRKINLIENILNNPTYRHNSGLRIQLEKALSKMSTSDLSNLDLIIRLKCDDAADKRQDILMDSLKANSPVKPIIAFEAIGHDGQVIGSIRESRERALMVAQKTWPQMVSHLKPSE